MNKLNELRTERGFSYRGLEIKTGINYSSLAKYEKETREPRINDLKKLANFFEVSIDYLLCYSGCYVYANYKNENFTFKIRDDFYKELINDGFIFFENDKRFVDLNTIFKQPFETNLLPLILEMEKIKMMDSLFDIKNPSLDDIKFDDIIDIELNRSFINKIKDAIK